MGLCASLDVQGAERLSDRVGRTQEIFADAVELSATERLAFVDSACGDDDGLRERVETLLRAFDEAGGFFVEEQGLDAVARDRGERPGDVVGRYTLLQPIGEGGFGTVWMASQSEPVKRNVALKILKRGVDTRHVVARFEAERQALALMDHPSIASVFDGGETDGGLPYFVMELVRGVPITEHCERAELDLAARLGLFQQVCDAVQHAHAKGVIHRDLKPSNVLVAEVEGRAVPKVIDFGIAKSVSVELTRRTVFTELRQMLGTPDYMAPEQAAMTSLDIDTRADVYSLGVLLYELLTGTTPFDAKSLLRRGYAEMLRVIREDDPQRPSTRISTIAAKPATPQRVTMTKLGRLLRGDLDWIVMRALEKERERRYATPVALAEDIQRFLDHEPVDAGPPNFWYRTAKYLRRHRAATTAAALVSVALVVGLAVAILGWNEAVLQQRIAEGERYALEAGLAAERDPTLGVLLGIEAATRLSGPNPRSALFRALRDHREQRTIFAGHGYVTSLAYAPDGATLLSTGADGALRIWNPVTGELVRELKGHTSKVEVARFSRDGARVVSASEDHTARIFEVESGASIELAGHAAGVVDVRFGPDENTVVTASLDATAKLWDAKSGALRQTLIGHDKPLRQAKISPAGDVVLTAARDGTARLWRAADGRVLHVLPLTRDRERAMAFSNTYHLVDAHFAGRGLILTEYAAGLRDVRVWNGATGEMVRGWTEGYRHAIFGSNPLIAHMAYGQGIRGLNIASGKHRYSHDTRGWTLRPTTLDADEQRVARVSPDNSIGVYHLRTGQVRELLVGHTQAPAQQALAFHPSGGAIASGGGDDTVRVWDLESPLTGSWVQPFVRKGKAGSFRHARMLVVDGKRMVVATQAGLREPRIRVWRRYEVHDGEGARVADGEDEQVEGELDAQRDADVFVFTVDDATVSVRDVRDGSERARFEAEPAGGVPVLSPDGALLARWRVDGGYPVSVYGSANGELVRRVGEEAEFHVRLAFSPDGTKIATSGGRDHAVRVYDIATGARVLEFVRESGWLVNITWSPDGSRILVAGSDHVVSLHDARDGAELGRYVGVPNEVQRVGFLVDDSLAWVMHHNRLFLLDPRTCELFAKIETPGETLKDVDVSADPDYFTVLTSAGHLRRWPRDPLAYARDHKPRELSEGERERFSVR